MMTTRQPLDSSELSSPEGKLQLDLAQRLALGTRLTELREERGLTQLEVAQQALGFTVSHAAVSRLERGILEKVDEDRLHKLAEFYGETVESLLAEMLGREKDVEPEEYRPADALVVQPGFGNRIFNLRQAAGLTKTEMAEKLGFSSNGSFLINQWEKEEVSPQPDTLLDMAIAMGVSASWIITGKRAKPITPTFAMRMRSLQKLYGLSNRELSNLAEFDIEHGPKLIHRLSRARITPSSTQVVAIAKALDVPVEWIMPPDEEFESPGNPAPKAKKMGRHELMAEVHDLTPLSKQSQSFLNELADLFALSAISDNDIATLRTKFMKELMKNMRKQTVALAA